MAGPSVELVEDLGIDAVQLAHPDREITIRRLDEYMIMVGHEAIGVADPVVALVDMLEGVEEVQAVVIVLEDGFLLIAAGSNVIQRTRIFNAKGTGHAARIAKGRANVKPQDLTLCMRKRT